MTLVAEIADTYIGLRTAQEQLRISRENLKLQRDIAGLVAEKYRAGLTDDIALNQANYAVETTQSLIPALAQQVTASSKALANLTGVLPALLSLGGALLSMYLMLFAIGLITTITEWHKINASISRKVLSVFTFPIFMFTYIPVSFAALFVKVEWKPIHHTVTAKELGRG